MTFYPTENISELVDNRVGGSNGSSGGKGRCLMVLGDKPRKTLKALDKPRTYGFEKELYQVRTPLLYPAELRPSDNSDRGCAQLPPAPCGAGEGNRTPITSLEGWSSTIELHPHADFWSGREDLNLRPPAPKAGALPDCATPRPRPAGSIPECES